MPKIIKFFLDLQFQKINLNENSSGLNTVFPASKTYLTHIEIKSLEKFSKLYKDYKILEF